MNTPITAMDFTSDGTAIALGTGSGKIIVKGWRSAEEDDQMIALDDNGGEERVVALAIQVKYKHSKRHILSILTDKSVVSNKQGIQSNQILHH